MKNIIGCSIILKDDFNNILIIKKEQKKNFGLWKCVGRLKKGRENNEKCISNSVKEELNTLIFDLKEIKEFKINDTEDYIMIYEGKIKDYMNLGKKVMDMKWISKKEIENYEFLDGEKELLLEYFKK
ncbi:hypothetical protein [Clostridium sp.]|uniref:hypothetical protein n=1 Tax=Clostridium sp. TaxID=1506 RepID=UPI002A918FCE|nr:hypothetical protein [Clostridium sp.]MDY6012076.1 hypothetical protein [Clostridium sp.]